MKSFKLFIALALLGLSLTLRLSERPNTKSNSRKQENNGNNSDIQAHSNNTTANATNNTTGGNNTNSSGNSSLPEDKNANTTGDDCVPQGGNLGKCPTAYNSNYECKEGFLFDYCNGGCKKACPGGSSGSNAGNANSTQTTNSTVSNGQNNSTRRISKGLEPVHIYSNGKQSGFYTPPIVNKVGGQSWKFYE